MVNFWSPIMLFTRSPIETENHGLEAESTKQGRIQTNGTLRMVRRAEKKFSRVFAFFSVR